MSEAVFSPEAMRNATPDQLRAKFADLARRSYTYARLSDYYQSVLAYCLDVRARVADAGKASYDKGTGADDKGEVAARKRLLRTIFPGREQRLREIQSAKREYEARRRKHPTVLFPSAMALGPPDFFETAYMAHLMEEAALSEENLMPKINAFVLEVIARDIRRRMEEANQEAKKYAKILMENGKAMRAVGFQIDEVSKTPSYTSRWSPEPPRMMLFETRDIESGSKFLEIANVLRVHDENGARIEVRCTPGGFDIAVEGNPFLVRCSLQEFRCQDDHSTLASHSHGSFYDAKTDSVLHKAFAYRDWEGHRRMAAPLAMTQPPIWFYHQAEPGCGPDHFSNLIFYQNPEGVFDYIVIIDNLVYRRNGEATAESWKPGEIGNRERVVGFDYKDTGGESWLVAYMGNLAYHIRISAIRERLGSVGTGPIFPLPGMPVYSCADLPQADCRVDALIRYHSGNNTMWRSSLLPNYGAYPLLHTLVEPGPPDVQRGDANLPAELLDFADDEAGAHVLGASDVLKLPGLAMGFRTRDRGERRSDGTLKLVGWSGELDEIAIHGGFLYRVNRLSGRHERMEEFRYLGPDGRRMVGAFRDCSFFFCPENDRLSPVRQDDILYRDWNGDVVRSRVGVMPT